MMTGRSSALHPTDGASITIDDQGATTVTVKDTKIGKTYTIETWETIEDEQMIANGVFVVRTPFAAQAATSTVSKPTPLRAKIFTLQSLRATDAAVTRGRFTWIAS